MQRLPRYILNAATLVSLILCISLLSGNGYLTFQNGVFFKPDDFATSRYSTYFGIAHLTQWTREAQHYYSVRIDRLPLCLLAAILPAFRATTFAVRWTRGTSRFESGQCLHCGYDLRATPNQCPECGTANTP